jgi:hypothetical protein
MEFTKDGTFKVGNTTLSTPIQIRIPDYGYELPEIHASSPLSMPTYISVANIINWLERGINIDFCDQNNMERVFFFIMEYNRFAKEENKKFDDDKDHYRLALNAQNRLFRDINYKHEINNKKADEVSPFKVKPYKRTANAYSSDYKNSYSRKQKALMPESMKKKKVKPISPENVYAFDIFTSNPDTLLAESDPFSDIDFGA